MAEDDEVVGDATQLFDESAKRRTSPTRSAENSPLSESMAEDVEVGVGDDDEQIEAPTRSPLYSPNAQGVHQADHQRTRP